MIILDNGVYRDMNQTEIDFMKYVESQDDTRSVEDIAEEAYLLAEYNRILIEQMME